MEFFVDIADIEEVKKVNDYFTIEGFTTNPNILTKSSKSLKENLNEYKKFVEETGLKVFVQVTEEKADDMVEQAKTLVSFFGSKVVVKLPAVKEGYKACKICTSLGISICMTVIHSVNQAILAAKSGASYVAPYVSHIDNIGQGGTRCVKEMVEAFKRYNLNTKVLGASFRDAWQIEELASVGCDAVTITPQFFDLLIKHPATDESMSMFKKAWEDRFGSEQITDSIK